VTDVGGVEAPTNDPVTALATIGDAAMIIIDQANRDHGRLTPSSILLLGKIRSLSAAAARAELLTVRAQLAIARANEVTNLHRALRAEKALEAIEKQRVFEQGMGRSG
jgi:hypothetical protein